MESERLDKDLITDASRWRLAMKIGRDAIDVVAYSPIEDNSLIQRRIPLNTAKLSPLQAIEEAVYDNPLILSDFGRIQCLIDTPDIVIAPKEAGNLDADTLGDILRASRQEFDGAVETNALPASNAVIVMGLPREMSRFLRRTFVNPDLQHHLTPLCRYFLNLSRRVNAPRVYANLRAGSMDIIAVDRDRLLMANTFAFSHISDSAYYIVASRRSLGLDGAEMYLSGDAGVREQLAPMLRRVIPSVMPVIFPSTMFRAGKEAMTAPFELIILPLCE